jgi:hypothetical protein
VIYILAASILAGVSWVQLQAELPSRSELGVAAAGAVGLMVLWWRRLLLVGGFDECGSA